MLIGFSGFKTAGKDAAASVLIEEYGFKKVALADPVRALAYAINPIVSVDFDITECVESTPFSGGWHEWESNEIRLQWLIDEFGWDHCKNHYPEVRRLMQAVGTEGGRALFGEDFWVNQLGFTVPDIFADDTRYVLTDARFTNEGMFVKNGGGKLIWIDRPGLYPDGHASESGELKEIADYFITNDTALKDLQEDVRFAMFMLDISKER